MPDKQWDDIYDFEKQGSGDLWDEERHRPPYKFIRCATCGEEIDPAWGVADCGRCIYETRLKQERAKWRQRKKENQNNVN